MQGKSHLALGIVTGVVGGVALYDNNTATATFAVATVFGSIYPDIDCPAATLGHILKPISCTFERIFGHRGFIHSPLNCAIICLVLYGITTLLSVHAAPLIIGFALGFFLHLIQDTCTKGGIPWLYPISKKSIHILPIATGNPIEYAITALLICSIVGIVYFLPKYF